MVPISVENALKQPVIQAVVIIEKAGFTENAP